jgi:hypothetical protein
MDELFEHWLAALEARHLADLRVAEVTRALRALSSAYVERRHRVAHGATLDSRGKRAAFALFYAPLHFIVTRHIVEAVGAGRPTAIVDIGCGTGSSGAAWAVAAGGVPISGFDRHPWAVDEARWTYAQLRLDGQARIGDAARWGREHRPGADRPGTGLVAAYVLNELPDAARQAVEDRLYAAAERGSAMLVIEPIARPLTPWWETTARRFAALGARADEWRLAPDLPPLLKLFDKAAGLKHQTLTARSLYCAGR